MDKILALWNYTVQRSKEPSTHAALTALFALAVTKLNIDPGIVHDGLIALSVAFGGLGIFVKEAKPLTDVERID